VKVLKREFGVSSFLEGLIRRWSGERKAWKVILQMTGSALNLYFAGILHLWKAMVYLYYTHTKSLADTEGRRWTTSSLVLVAAVLV
jgi:hypothetical protein